VLVCWIQSSCLFTAGGQVFRQGRVLLSMLI